MSSTVKNIADWTINPIGQGLNEVGQELGLGDTKMLTNPLGFLFNPSKGPKPNQARSAGSLPSREDIVSQILNEQLNVLKNRSTLGGQTKPQGEQSLASSTLFGI